MRLGLGSTAVAAALSLLLAAGSAAAQTTAEKKAAAEALFQEARKLFAAKDYVAACKKYEQSNQLDPGIGTLLYLADCYERVGRTASAWATFTEAASLARASGQDDRAEQGDTRAKALEEKLSRLSLNVAAENREVQGLVVKRGEQRVEPSVWGVPVPVDPGKYVVTAEAPGYLTFRKEIEVGGNAASEALEVPALQQDPNAAVAGPEPETPPPAPVGPVNTSEPDSGVVGADTGEGDGSGQRIAGWVITGAGVIGLGVGSVFGLQAINKNSDAEEVCDGTQCRDQQGLNDTQDAKDAARISNIAFVVGGVATVTGIVLIATAPSSSPSQSARAPRLRLAPAVGPGTAGLDFRGTF